MIESMQLFEEVTQVGIVVRDLKSALAQYRAPRPRPVAHLQVCATPPHGNAHQGPGDSV